LARLKNIMTQQEQEFFLVKFEKKKVGVVEKKLLWKSSPLFHSFIPIPGKTKMLTCSFSIYFLN